MNIALFATGKVGHAIATFLGENHELLSCLVLDKTDTSGYNQRIATALGVTPDKIYLSDALYEPQTMSAIRAMDLDLTILAWWPYIVKPEIIQLANLGCLNLHPSYLPYNRGKHYNFWTIVEDAPFGVTLHFVDTGIDTGDIAFQTRIEKTWEDTGQTLYEKAQSEIVRLFIEKFPLIRAGQIPRMQQDVSKGTFHKARELDAASQVDLDKNYKARDLLNLIRARTFKPHPGAWFVDGGNKYEVRIEITRVLAPIEVEL